MSRTRHAFTLIELLVVLAVMSVLVGLLVPAVQQARRAAARAKSLNNLKQQALAIHLFHDNHNRLPTREKPRDRQVTPGVHRQLFPYLEQAAMAADPESLGTVSVLIDPTDPTFADGTNPRPVSYAFNVRVVGDKTNSAQYWLDQRVIPFRHGPFVDEGLQGVGTLLAVIDGTSNTTLLTQRFVDCYSVHCSYGTATGTPSLSTAVYAPDLLPQLGIYKHDCICGAAQTVNSSIQVALCDGSVRTVSEGGVQSSWFAASTPAGGEVLGDW